MVNDIKEFINIIKSENLFMISIFIVISILIFFKKEIKDFLKRIYNDSNLIKRNKKKLQSFRNQNTKLFNEMAYDFQKKEWEFSREFILMKSTNSYGGKSLAYYYDYYPNLLDICKLMVDNSWIMDITYNNVCRYRLDPSFHKYLLSIKVDKDILPDGY